MLLFSHRPIKIEAAYISCSLPEAKIITANHNLPLNTEQWSTQNKKKWYLCLTRKENCCPSNYTRTIIGLEVHVLPEILGTAFRGNKVALLFVRTINLDTEIVFSGKWKALRFITWVNLILYLCCNVFYCDVMYFGSGLKRKENLGNSYFPLLRHFIVLCCIKDWKHWKERG